MTDELTIREKVEINASAEKVWKVLTEAQFIRQWDELPEDWNEAALTLGSVVEWGGHSKMTVVAFEPNRLLRSSLELPKVDLKPSEYDVSYLYALEEHNGATTLSLVIGDFAPLPKAGDYYNASMEFTETAKGKIKELAENS